MSLLLLCRHLWAPVEDKQRMQCVLCDLKITNEYWEQYRGGVCRVAVKYSIDTNADRWRRDNGEACL